MAEIDLSNYQGHWVALFDQLVVGVGQTPQAALNLAKRNRSKDRFTVQFVEKLGGTPLNLPPLLVQLRPFFLKQSQPIYLVGGAVRDILLGKSVHDLDFVVPQGAIRLSKRTGDEFGWPVYILDQERDIGRVVIAHQNTTLDFAKFRGANLEEDLKDRDFTINALALPATAQFQESIIDLVEGVEALANREIRLANPDALKNDPVRAIRAIRQSHSLSLKIDAITQQAIQEAVGLLTQPSAERIRDEWLKLLSIQEPMQAIQQLHEHGLLTHILPELDQRMNENAEALATLDGIVQIELFVFDLIEEPKINETFSHVLHPFRQALQQFWLQDIDGGLNGRILLRLSALFFQLENTIPEAIANRLRSLAFSNQAVAHVKLSLRESNRLNKLLEQFSSKPLSARQVYRYYLDFENAGIDVLFLTVAMQFIQYNQTLKVGTLKKLSILLEGRFEKYDQAVNPPIVINGRELMKQLDLTPGPEIGRLLRLIKEEQAAGEITTKKEAILFAKKASN